MKLKKNNMILFLFLIILILFFSIFFVRFFIAGKMRLEWTNRKKDNAVYHGLGKRSIPPLEESDICDSEYTVEFKLPDGFYDNFMDDNIGLEEYEKFQYLNNEDYSIEIDAYLIPIVDEFGMATNAIYEIQLDTNKANKDINKMMVNNYEVYYTSFLNKNEYNEHIGKIVATVPLAGTNGEIARILKYVIVENEKKASPDIQDYIKLFDFEYYENK